MKECEAQIVFFNVDDDKFKHIVNAGNELAKAGITFDTSISSERTREWEFDWSLKGDVKVMHKKFINN